MKILMSLIKIKMGNYSQKSILKYIQIKWNNKCTFIYDWGSTFDHVKPFSHHKYY